ncbi:MAG: hypothetical protein MUE40_04405, partial [Anaerolineae bacterium]|nr:hypothetical protein [Anaerolineae bacterium]
MARNRSSLATATGLLLLTLLYAGLYLLYRQAEPLFPAEPDIDNYSAALAQHEQPALFQRDPAFADGLLTGMLWDGAYLYMRLFQVLHQAFPEDVSRQLALLHIIPSALSLLSFYWLLRGFHLPRVTATLLATAFSLWLLLLFYPGIPSLYYFALTPLLLGALWRYVFAPALHGQALWLPGVALLGAGIGLSPYLVNSVNGLAFNLLTLLLAGLLWLLRRLPLPAFVALLVGLLPALALTSLGGGTGGTGARLTAEAVHLWSQTLQLPSVQPAVYAALYMAIILTGLAAWRTGQRVVKLLFITSSGVLWIMVYGNIVAVLLLYLVLKTWQRRDEPLDAALAVAVSAGVFIGPPLLWIVHEVWSLTQWHTLLFIAWQMYRFHFIGYFIVVLLLARLTLDATRAIPDVRLQWLTQAGLAALIVLQPSRFVTLTAEIETLVLAFMVALLLLLPHARHSFAARPVPLPRLALL